jgi:uncharacterized membrane protein (DUF485 family)
MRRLSRRPPGTNAGAGKSAGLSFCAEVGGASFSAMSSPDSSGTSPVPWEQISRDPDFRRLLASKARFVAPATAFFLLYYFALPILVGYAPELMARPILGDLNAAYLFALSQFFMAWILAGFYVCVAAGWDRQAAAILKKFGQA